ncbi:hypothetical protein L0U95_10735 [Burkholderia cenocepacia]|uniref:hypothetical protein n=1 Tax=Burkholderia cenocepacia TaxID=95486 RepID=UPI001F2292C9|nr:hypothetical protein [Burkholderia cenocepacia]UJH72293.1 hypothetical protein L0U95_10735 [Burkholderia cenocepacia]
MDLDRVLDKYPDIGKYNRYFGIYLAAVMREVDFPNGKAPFEEIARFDWLRGDDRDFFSDDMLTLFVKYSNDAVEQIRRIGTSKAFGTWVKAIERQSCENEERLQSLFDACLSINRSILVLRFDLGYSQLHCDAELLGNAGVSYDDVRKHREALRRFLKSDLRHRLPPGACKGIVFAIKLEYGLDKGYHFHVVVALNGKIVCKDGAIAEMICDEWRNEITEGRGGACNCNRRRYRRRGIGSIKRKEVEKLDILKKEVLPYITKVDFYGKMVKPEKHRVFWTSHPPAITANPMSGDRSPDGGDIDLE